MVDNAAPLAGDGGAALLVAGAMPLPQPEMEVLLVAGVMPLPQPEMEVPLCWWRAQCRSLSRRWNCRSACGRSKAASLVAGVKPFAGGRNVALLVVRVVGVMLSLTGESEAMRKLAVTLLWLSYLLILGLTLRASL